MSIHPSLGSAAKSSQAKSVMKRTDRLKYLRSKGLWTPDGKAFGLPKVKAVRIKIKKEKTEKPAEGASATAAASPAASADQKIKAAPKK
jgi:small basic protein (TIGR04137 family)